MFSKVNINTGHMQSWTVASYCSELIFNSDSVALFWKNTACGSELSHFAFSAIRYFGV